MNVFEEAAANELNDYLDNINGKVIRTINFHGLEFKLVESSSRGAAYTISLFLSGQHLVVINEVILSKLSIEQASWVVYHEISHIVEGHTTDPKYRGRHIKQEFDADIGACNLKGLKGFKAMRFFISIMEILYDVKGRKVWSQPEVAVRALYIALRA